MSKIVIYYKSALSYIRYQIFKKIAIKTGIKLQQQYVVLQAASFGEGLQVADKIFHTSL